MLLTIDPSAAIHSLAGHLTAVDVLIEFTATYLVYAVMAVLLLVWLRPRQGLRACVAAAAAGLGAVAVSGIIGMIWDQPRPFVAGHFTPLISHAADASFPSDHVAALAAVAAVLWFAFRRLSVVVWALALVVGLARIYVGVHYVGDVVGGIVVGLGCGTLAWYATGLVPGSLAILDRVLVRARLRPRPPAGTP